MAEAHVSEMIGNSVAVVDQIFTRLGTANDVFTHVKAFKREVNGVIDLLTSAASPEHRISIASLLTLFESLEADN